MKKALALVLALVLALSMAVSAFAVDYINLSEASTLTKDNKIKLTELDKYNGASAATLKNTYKVDAEGGEFYFVLTVGGKYAQLKNIEASCTGAVASAEVLEFNPETMVKPGNVWYYVYDGTTFAASRDDAWNAWRLDFDAQYIKLGNKDFVAPQYKLADGTVASRIPGDYEYAVALCDYLEDGAEDGSKYSVVAANGDGLAYLYVLKLTVEENWTAAYKEGSFKVTATTADKKSVAFEGDVISDVVIYEYEQIKWAAENEDNVDLYAKGYSDFETYLNGGYGKEYVVNNLRTVPNATVVSTTAFRAVAGKDLTVELIAKKAFVEIEEVAAGQKGVNFDFYGLTAVDADGKDPAKTGKPVDALVFGFYGDQVIKSEYTITYKTGFDVYDLREEFDVKVEEDDILTYYILKDGKLVQELVVDYMTADLTKEVVLELTGSNATLGEYEIRLDVESTADAGEENPNTGAESVVGVVAALAVVSVATAAAVSLKK